MIVFMHEDPAYVSWISRHRAGFVLETKRKMTKRNALLHRASCARLRPSSRKPSHWTTGRNVKACATTRDELVTWTFETIGSKPRYCEDCRPNCENNDGAANTLSSDTFNSAHLTKLRRDIVSYVLEIAVIHLDGMDSGYHLTVSDLADACDRSVRRIAASVLYLASHDCLTLSPEPTVDLALNGTTVVYPTAKALREFPAFASMSSEELEAELNKLSGE